MATKDELKEYIKGRVKTNTNKEITGNGLQTVLCRMVDDLDLNDSCRVVLVQYTNGPTTFNTLKEQYNANKAVIVQFEEGYNVLITQVSSTAFTGYRFNLNSGSTSQGGLGIVSMTATRYIFTADGLTIDNFTVSSDGSGSGGGSTTLTWAYSDYAGKDTPSDPDTDPTLWYTTKKESSIWAALKETGGVWNIWRLVPYNGTDGKDGKTYYTWIKYADDSQGNGMSDSPIVDGVFKKYIGFGYNKETTQESDDPADYVWALFKGTDGTDGIPGEPGADGKTFYTWIKYADSLGDDGYPESMYDIPTTATEYIGIAVNQAVQTEGTNSRAYTWSKFKGDTGVPGTNGIDGRGIKSTQISYVLSDQGSTPPESGWNTNIPDIVEGKYLWSKTFITYTDGITSTVYSVSYIGKDGNDGKNGTSVTIKGTLDSIEDLPTDPTPEPGDGYIINGDLWTYTGTELENEKNHNGFTNAGPIKGDTGDSACLHMAWANSLSPDWTNFTTQKPSGQKFKYLGTYVDYSPDPSTCVDSQDPTDYSWQDVSGEDGESALVADLDNEIESITLDSEGKTTKAITFTPMVSMWYGLTKLTLDSITAKVVGTDYSSNVATSVNTSTGQVTVSLSSGVLITSFQVEITVNTTVNKQTYIKQVVFSVNCVKAGAPGEDAVLYSIQPSVSAIHKDKNGNLNPTIITCKKMKTVGGTIEETQDGVLKYKIDTNAITVYAGSIACAAISSKIRFEYYIDDILCDAEDVFVIQDGQDGKDGNGVYAVLDEEMIAAQVDYDGVSTIQQTWATKFSIWSGTTKQTLTSLAISANDPVIVDSDKDSGVVAVQVAKGVTLKTKYEILITGTAYINGETVTRKATMVLICPRPGQPGDSPIIYQVEPSETVISKHSNGTYSANSLSCQVIVIQGSESAVVDLSSLKGAYIYYYTDGSSTRKTYSGALVPGVDFTSSIKFQFVLSSFLWDSETVLILEDGKDGDKGDDGDTPYIIESKTKTEYAITMDTTVPTSWSSTPIVGIPGQYLWIRITYTWSNGSTTISLSYSRCGSDGADGEDGANGVSKATIVTFQGNWKADGLYTGMEDDSTIRVDVVYYQGTGETEGKYYMAIQSKQFINQTTPAPNTTAGKAYWGAFQGQFANLATGFFFSELAVIENAIIRILQTAYEGERIETEGNTLAVYDEDNVQRVVIDPEGSDPFTTIEGVFTNTLDQMGVFIPISSLNGRNYSGGKIIVLYYGFNNDDNDWLEEIAQADALMIAMITGDTYNHVYSVLNGAWGSDNPIPISSGIPEGVALGYIYRNLKNPDFQNSDSPSSWVKAGNIETINYNALTIGFSEEDVDRIIAGGGTAVADSVLIPDLLIGGKGASLKNATASLIKDRYTFNGQTVLVTFQEVVRNADSIYFEPTTSSVDHLSEVSGFDGELDLQIVFKNKTRNTECVFMSLFGEYTLPLTALFQQSEYERYFSFPISSGDSKTETAAAVPELIEGIYDVVLRITTKITTKGDWSNLSLQGLDFNFSLSNSTNNVNPHATLIFCAFAQGKSVKIHSSGISVIRTAQEYFQLALKNVDDNGNESLDLEIRAQDSVLKLNSNTAFMGPLELYQTVLPGRCQPGSGYLVVDIHNEGTNLDSITFSKDSVLSLIELASKRPVYLQTVYGVAPMIVPPYTNQNNMALSASIISAILISGTWATIRYDFWLSASTGKFTYRQVTM